MKRKNPFIEAATWNESVPVGSDVIVTKDDGTELRTKTRSEAWVVGDHTAIVKVDGISGGYNLSRIRRASRETHGRAE